MLLAPPKALVAPPVPALVLAPPVPATLLFVPPPDTAPPVAAAPPLDALLPPLAPSFDSLEQPAAQTNSAAAVTVAARRGKRGTAASCIEWSTPLT
jgi:hypothetical protein